MGNTRHQPIPKRVLGIKKAVQAACGEDHTLVLQRLCLPSLPFDNTIVDERFFLCSHPAPIQSTSDVAVSAAVSRVSMIPRVDDADHADAESDQDSEDSRPLNDSRANNNEEPSTNMASKIVPSLSSIASTPQLMSLRDICQREVAKHVNSRLVLSILSIAQTLSCVELEHYCIAFCQE